MTRIGNVLFAIALCAAPALADDLKTLSGKTNSGTLEKITDTDIVVSGSSTPINQALELILRQGRSVPTAEKYIDVQLTDDSVLRCTKLTFGVKETTLCLLYTSDAADE